MLSFDVLEDKAVVSSSPHFDLPPALPRALAESDGIAPGSRAPSQLGSKISLQPSDQQQRQDAWGLATVARDRQELGMYGGLRRDAVNHHQRMEHRHSPPPRSIALNCDGVRSSCNVHCDNQEEVQQADNLNND